MEKKQYISCKQAERRAGESRSQGIRGRDKAADGRAAESSLQNIKGQSEH